MKVIYRISDGGNPKNKPSYVTKRGCFTHFMKISQGYEVFVIADNVSDDTFMFLNNYIPKENIKRTNLHNSRSFIYAVQFAIENFKDNEKVYLVEDDYIHTLDALDIINEGLDISDYVSGYDHPDKYLNHNEGGPNPFISEGGELTRVLMTKNKHWKLTNSCCMTFATTVSVLKKDLEIYVKYCNGNNINDFGIFCELIGHKKRKLVSPIPSVSTHGEIEWLSKLFDWEKVFNETI